MRAAKNTGDRVVHVTTTCLRCFGSNPLLGGDNISMLLLLPLSIRKTGPTEDDGDWVHLATCALHHRVVMVLLQPLCLSQGGIECSPSENRRLGIRTAAVTRWYLDIAMTFW